jgi:hypothetical protein
MHYCHITEKYMTHCQQKWFQQNHIKQSRKTTNAIIFANKLLLQPSIHLIPYGHTSLSDKHIIRRESGMCPEMMRRGSHIQSNLLLIGRRQNTKGLPGVNLAIRVHNATCLKLVSTIHWIRELVLAVHRWRGHSKGRLANIVVNFQSMEPLGIGTSEFLLTYQNINISLIHNNVKREHEITLSQWGKFGKNPTQCRFDTATNVQGSLGLTFP